MTCRNALSYILVFAAASIGVGYAQPRVSRTPGNAGGDARSSVLVQPLPNSSQQITPTAPAGSRFEPLNPELPGFPTYTVGQAVTSLTSPDRNTLLILTSGYNLLNTTSGANAGQQVNSASTEFVFVYNISHYPPVKTQVIQVPNTYQGMVFDPSGKTFYVSGGVDDNVHIYDLGSAGWAERSSSPVALGHYNSACASLLGCGNGLAVSPEAAGIAITADGSTLVVANYYNDSISILTKNSASGWAKTSELDLRPGKISPTNSGTPGGEYPLWVSIAGNTTAYVSSIRDREIDVVGLGSTPSLLTRIKVLGQPNKMALSPTQPFLYVAEDQSDTVAVINTVSNQLVNEIPVGAPERLLKSTPNLTGNNTNSVTVSPDGGTLYATNGNTNNVAVVALTTAGNGTVTGLIPTGRYPNSVSVSGDGVYLFVVNGKSPTGPNIGNCDGGAIPSLPAANCNASNQYNLQLIKAGFQSFPVPTASQLATLSQQVAVNNNFGRQLNEADTVKMAEVASRIQHVIYIIKENRTYDQILGDLPVGNGDPDLTEFGQTTTPNLHALAQNFVTLDNFYDRSEVSMDGWPWSVSARSPDIVEKMVTVNYAGKGQRGAPSVLSNDSEGTNRNVNVSLPTLAQRLQADPLSPQDPDVLPGTVDTSAPDGPEDQPNKGYLWDAAMRAGVSMRNYGFFIDLARYQTLPAPYNAIQIPLLTNPFSTNTTVAYSTNATLAAVTDPYFRGFDNSFPDYYRFTEWQRDFNANYANGGLPQLSFVRFMHDHTGNFSTAIAGVNTPDLDVADNDYAVGLLIQQIANSQYKNNTLIFVIEDDSQDGGDHVDSHRSIAYIIGPYVKQNAVVSTQYNTTDFVRTIETVLGLQPMNLNDALAVPMADVFDLTQTTWNYTATPSPLLANTTLPITYPTAMANRHVRPTHDSQYWAKATAGMDFSVEDRIDFDRYNEILWKGLMGNRPYPEESNGKDLRQNRAKLLARYQKSQQKVQDSQQ